MKRISVIIGTRPEAIKFGPLILAFLKKNDIDLRIILTGQHYELVDQVNELFGIVPNKNLKIMIPGQTLTRITNEVLMGLKEDFNEYRPQLVLVQGDTTSAFSAALAAFYEKIPVGHVEAGLRTNQILNPYPEEANRRIISQLASIHFAPTKIAYENLKKAGVLGEVYLTGNTVIDSLLFISKETPIPKIRNVDFGNQNLILATVHRRENWGDRLKDIARGLKKILDEHIDYTLIIPMHPNKKVRIPIEEILGDHSRAVLTEPLSYDSLVGTLKHTKLILTDSGGLQEEAPTLGIPILVLRDSTERPEAIQYGTAKIVGSDPTKIYEEASKLLTNKKEYQKMSKATNPFGDGKASERIVNYCIKFLEKNDRVT